MQMKIISKTIRINLFEIKQSTQGIKILHLSIFLIIRCCYSNSLTLQQWMVSLEDPACQQWRTRNTRFLKYKETKTHSFLSCSGLLRIQSGSSYPSMRLCFFLCAFYTSPWTWKTIKSVDDQRAKPHWSQTLQTLQMWSHVISIVSSPYGLTSSLQL